MLKTKKTMIHEEGQVGEEKHRKESDHRTKNYILKLIMYCHSTHKLGNNKDTDVS